MDQRDLAIHEPCGHYGLRLPDSLDGSEYLATGRMAPPATSNRLPCNPLRQRFERSASSLEHHSLPANPSDPVHDRIQAPRRSTLH
jgi:hypothetical protein